MSWSNVGRKWVSCKSTPLQDTYRSGAYSCHPRLSSSRDCFEARQLLPALYFRTFVYTYGGLQPSMCLHGSFHGLNDVSSCYNSPGDVLCRWAHACLLKITTNQSARVLPYARAGFILKDNSDKREYKQPSGTMLPDSPKYTHMVAGSRSGEGSDRNKLSRVLISALNVATQRPSFCPPNEHIKTRILHDP